MPGRGTFKKKRRPDTDPMPTVCTPNADRCPPMPTVEKPSVQGLPQTPGQVLDVLPGDAAGTRAAGHRPFVGLAGEVEGRVVEAEVLGVLMCFY